MALVQNHPPHAHAGGSASVLRHQLMDQGRDPANSACCGCPFQPMASGSYQRVTSLHSAWQKPCTSQLHGSSADHGKILEGT